MKELSNAQIARVLLPYSAQLAAPLGEQIRRYSDLLLRWNSRISLTTITKPLDILCLHFGESLFAVQSVPIRHGRLADVGSGAGFPGIPIRMASNDINLTLIEANHKKRVFLAEVIRDLSLSNVEIYPGRMEAMHDRQSEFDYVTARAIAIDQSFLSWASAHLKPGGSLILWLGEGDCARVSRSSHFAWRDPIKIPDSDRRFILVGTKPGEAA